jgi:hypothetical protein
MIRRLKLSHPVVGIKAVARRSFKEIPKKKLAEDPMHSNVLTPIHVLAAIRILNRVENRPLAKVAAGVLRGLSASER